MLTVIAVVAGAVTGAVIGGLGGGAIAAVAGGMFGWLLARLSRLETDLTQAMRRIAAIEARRTAPVAAPRAPETAPRPATDPPKLPQAPATVSPAPPPVPPIDRGPRPVPASQPARPVEPPELRPPAPQPGSAATSLVQWLFGGNTIVKVGIGILFVGLAFLTKYAAAHVAVPIELRLSGVGVAAIVLLVIGWRLRERRPLYAQTLQGGAVAVLYLTLFASFKLFGVLGVGPAFGLMVIVAVLAAVLAVLQDASALALVGALGGFATPILASTGAGSHVALFSYYLVLDLGIAAVAWHKTWRPLNLVGFFFTFVVGTAWGILQYEDAHFASSEAFLAAFFLLFVAIMLMPARRIATARPVRPTDRWVTGTLLFGLPTITFALQYGLVEHTQYGAALSALALAVFYVGLAAWMRAFPQLAVVFEGSLAIGTVFVTLAIPFALDARAVAGAWALEGAGLVWLGFRQSRWLGRVFGYLLLIVAGAMVLFSALVYPRPTRLFDATLLNGVLIVVASLAGAGFVRHYSGRTSHVRVDAARLGADVERWAEPILIGWATLWFLVVAAVDIEAFVARPLQWAAWVTCTSAAAATFTLLSFRWRWRAVSFPAIGHAPLMALAVAALIGHSGGPFADGGWWAWPIALAVDLAVLRFAAPIWPRLLRDLAHVSTVVMVAGLGSLEGRAITSGWGDAASAWPWLGWLAAPAALLILLPLPAASRVWPVSAAERAYRAGGCAVLAIGLLLWALVANIASTGSAAPLPHVPLVNPLDLGVALALFGVWRWREGGRPFFVALAAVAFVWLNAILVRAFHHYMGVPFQLDAWVASLAVQTGLSLLWTATALVLMWIATRRGPRAPWIAGAVLLAAVVVKLLVIDLSGSGTVTRIVSFIGVGVLMLVIGYVAPLPGKEAPDEAR